MYKNNLEDVEWFTSYVNSFYWGIATVLLIGTVGTSDLEVVYVSVVLFVTVGVFAYILGSISKKPTIYNTI